MSAHLCAFAVNHMTIPAFGCTALETVCAEVDSAGLRLLASAEIERFKHWHEETETAARELVPTATEVGAEAVDLIPVNHGAGCGNGEQFQALPHAGHDRLVSFEVFFRQFARLPTRRRRSPARWLTSTRAYAKYGIRAAR